MRYRILIFLIFSAVALSGWMACALAGPGNP